ncbi:hypothetical protein OAL29_02205 [Candidatus Binatia bacterium]|nr:hypothetical protein [Candidatus Binatia bacterium]
MSLLHGLGLYFRPDLDLTAFDQVNDGRDEFALCLSEFGYDLHEIDECDVWFHDFLLALLQEVNCKPHAICGCWGASGMAIHKAPKKLRILEMGETNIRTHVACGTKMAFEK